MDETSTGISAPTDTSGGDVSSSSAGSLTSAPSDSQPVDGGEFVSSFLQGIEEKSADSQAPVTEAAPETPESVPSAGDGEQEQPAEALMVPETDDDLSKLTDQTAISHIRGLRQHVRQNLEPKAKAYDALTGKAQTFGLDDSHYEPAFQLMSGLLGVEPQHVIKDGQPQYDQTGQPIMEDVSSTLQFWQGLSQLSQPHLKQLLGDAVKYFPDYVAGRISPEVARQSLKIDEQTWQDFQRFQQDGAKGFVQSADYDPEIAKALPDHLREEYRLSNPDLQYGLNQLEPAVRQMMLEQNLRNRQTDEREKKAEQQRTQDAQQAQAQAAEKRVQDYLTQKNDAFLSDLAKTWNPYGPGDAKNDRMHKTVFREVGAAMQESPKAIQLMQGIDRALRENNTLALNSQWAQLNVEIVRLRNEVTAFYDELFQAGHGTRQQKRDESARLKAVTHTGGMPDNRAGDQIPEGDNRSALRAIAGSLGIGLT